MGTPPLRSAYAGDARLGTLLVEAGSPHSLAEAKELCAAIAAAPPTAGGGEDRWLGLIAAEASLTLAAELVALVAELAEGYRAAIADREAAPARLAALRAELARRGLSGFVVPRADEHQGEYVPPRAQRLSWLTGFSGSAGVAVVLAARAAIFVDGRYALQVGEQVDTGLFEPLHSTDTPPATWLAEALGAGEALGHDPWLHTERDAARLRTACEQAQARLVACETNPIDAIWEDQPPAPLAPVVPHDIAFAGESAADKRHRLAATLVKEHVDAAVVTAPDSIAWLLNIRGADVANTPLPLAFAMLHDSSEVDLFIDPRKLSPRTRQHLGNWVRVRAPDSLEAALRDLGREGKAVRIEPAGAPARLFAVLDEAGGTIVRREDPCAAPKARKNAVELDGIRAAHIRDGAALTRFLSWLDAEASGGGVDELIAAAKLAAFRAANAHFQGLSFDTISGAGPNGAIVHYHATPATNRRLEPDSLYLVDSGGQYLDGTTDVTRTVALGTPTVEHRDRFTRVLKGHIAIATARFPEGTSGSQLDTLARLHLWRAGIDYDHGTGHGVGSYLCVHEGPQRISKLPNRVPLEPGMVVSNEPGYYKPGAYGIRIENLVAVVEVGTPDGGEKPMLGFETLTKAPIDRALVEPALMTAEEIAWLDSYHADVRETLTPLLDPQTAAWLATATPPLET